MRWIAAIGNVVRKLMQDCKQPIDAGFFFGPAWPPWSRR
jgi:high-affinity nickel permease